MFTDSREHFFNEERQIVEERSSGSYGHGRIEKKRYDKNGRLSETIFDFYLFEYNNWGLQSRFSHFCGDRLVSFTIIEQIVNKRISTDYDAGLGIYGSTHHLLNGDGNLEKMIIYDGTNQQKRRAEYFYDPLKRDTAGLHYSNKNELI